MTTASPAYVLPPVEADSINTSTVPFGITDAMLTSSTVAETDYTAWNAATAYTAGDFAIRTTATTHAIYLRLISGTTATAPEDDATNWVRVSATNRWKMFDNLRRSLVTPMALLFLLLALWTMMARRWRLFSLALLLGATVLLSSLAFSFQHYFEYQLPQPAQTSQ